MPFRMESRDRPWRARRGSSQRAGLRARKVDFTIMTTPVILASAPFGPLGSPSIGLAQMQACLSAVHIQSKLIHFGLSFASEVGVAEYRLVGEELLFTPDLIGDWIFADALRGVPSDPEPWFRSVLEGGDPAHRKPHGFAAA